MLFSFLALWHSVPERASYGTEYAFGAQKGFLWYATHSHEAFGVKNRLLWYGRDIRCRKPLLWYGSDTRSWSRLEDAAVVGVVPVAAAMDLLA